MHRLGSNNEALHDGERYLEWQHSKNGSAFGSIPLAKVLSTVLAFHDERDTCLLTELRKPFASSGSLDNRVRKWTIAAGLCIEAKDEQGNPKYVGKGKREDVQKLSTRSQHGIRKGVASLMAERGATEYELMASFG